MNNFTLKVNPGKYLLTLTSFGSFDEKSPWRSKQDFDPDSIRLQLFPCNSAFTAVDCVADTANKKILNETKKELALRFQQCLLGNILVNVSRGGISAVLATHWLQSGLLAHSLTLQGSCLHICMHGFLGLVFDFGSEEKRVIFYLFSTLLLF